MGGRLHSDIAIGRELEACVYEGDFPGLLTDDVRAARTARRVRNAVTPVNVASTKANVVSRGASEHHLKSMTSISA